MLQLPTEKNLQSSFLGAFCFNNMRFFCQKDFDRLFEVNLPFPSNYFLHFWGPLLRFLIFANVDYTKSSSTLGPEELFNQLNMIFNKDSIIWGIFDILQLFPQPGKGS